MVEDMVMVLLVRSDAGEDPESVNSMHLEQGLFSKDGSSRGKNDGRKVVYAACLAYRV